MAQRQKTPEEIAANIEYNSIIQKTEDSFFMEPATGGKNTSVDELELVEITLSGRFLLAGAYLRDIRDYAAIKTQTGQDARGMQNNLTDLIEKEGDQSYAVKTVVDHLFDLAEGGNTAAAVALFSSYLLPLIDHDMINIDDKIIGNIFDLLSRFPIPNNPIKQTQSHIHILMALGYTHKEGCGTAKDPLTSAYFYARAAKMQFTVNPHDTDTQAMILDAMNESLKRLDREDPGKTILIRWGGLTKQNIRQNPKDHSAHQNVLEGLIQEFEKFGYLEHRNTSTPSSLRFGQ